MKELTRILWVFLIQYISCRLAGWETSVTFLTLALLIIWQGIFAKGELSYPSTEKQAWQERCYAGNVHGSFSSRPLFPSTVCADILQSLDL